MTIDAEKGEDIYSFTERLVILANKLNNGAQGREVEVEGRFNDILLFAHEDSRPRDLYIIYSLELEIVHLKNKYGGKKG